jgi:3-dehydroquinate synthetase
MAFALRAGRALGITGDAAAARVIGLLETLGLPVKLSRAEVEAALPFLAFDKKRRGDTVRAVFLADVGRAVTRRIPIADLARLYLEAASEG